MDARFHGIETSPAHDHHGAAQCGREFESDPYSAQPGNGPHVHFPLAGLIRRSSARSPSLASIGISTSEQPRATANQAACGSGFAPPSGSRIHAATQAAASETAKPTLAADMALHACALRTSPTTRCPTTSVFQSRSRHERAAPCLTNAAALAA